MTHGAMDVVRKRLVDSFGLAPGDAAVVAGDLLLNLESVKRELANLTDAGQWTAITQAGEALATAGALLDQNELMDFGRTLVCAANDHDAECVAFVVRGLETVVDKLGA